MCFKVSFSCLLHQLGWHPTPVLLPGKSYGRRSLVGCSPWGHQESDMTEQLHFHFPLSCIGEGNGNLLQCSCLENPRDGGAWWAAVYGVAQSWTLLKWLSSSSSSISRTTKRWKINIIPWCLELFNSFGWKLSLQWMHLFNKYLLINTWVGQTVHLGFSVTCYGKTQTNLLASLI